MLIARLDGKLERFFKIDGIFLRVRIEIGEHDLRLGVRCLALRSQGVLVLGLLLLFLGVVNVHFDEVRLWSQLAEAIRDASNCRQICILWKDHVIDVNFENRVILDAIPVHAFHAVRLF